MYCTTFQKGENTLNTFADLFAGIGGIRLGFEKAGFECVFSSEIDDNCKKMYYANFGETPWGDIENINADDIPDHDVLCAGFPCQPFSISGHKKGFEDARGTLFYHILRVAHAKQPKVLFLENVEFLRYHNKRNTLNTIVELLNQLGYTVRWQVLNASDFGVPQNRRRIIIVATHGEEFDFSIIKREPSVTLEPFLDYDGEFEYLSRNEYMLIENPKVQNSGLIFVGYRIGNIRKNGVRPNSEHLSRVHKQPNRIYSAEGVHPTLNSQEKSGRYFILTNNEVRKLTINECFRIMGFPEDFKKVASKGELYKQIGNSVCVPMVKSIADAIKAS